MTAKDRLLVWWRLLRPFSLTASLIPVLVGAVLARTEGHFRTGPLLAFLVAAVLIQAATNMFNEYFDYKRGLDTEEHVGIAGTIVRDGVSPKTVLALAWIFAGTAILIGLYISAVSSWWVFATGLACIGVAYIYSAGPYPLAYSPFGELASGFTMGPVIILLVYFVQSGSINLHALTVSAPIGLLIGAILLANNIRDNVADQAGGRRTLAILLGRRAATILYAAILGLSYAITAGLVLARSLTPWALLVLLTIPAALKPVRLFFQETEPVKLHPAVKGTAQLLARFGALLVAGMLISLI